MAKALYVFDNNAEISEALNVWTAALAKAAIAKSGRFTVALSGGSLPSVLAAKLVSNPTVEWSKWHIFFADERCVPHDDPESNYDLARKHFTSHVPIPSSNIHPINPDLVNNPEAAANDYADQLESVFGSSVKFDLIFLGMGPDGHTCSLFPGHKLLDEQTKTVSWLTDSPKPPPSRITLTYPVVNAATTVAFVATGESKADALHRIIDLGEALPSGRVKPASGELYWFLDGPAVKGLTAKTQKLKL
ncbi:hypothetical protein SmJEL517_g01120 [Synchytrium microbalum]|uniref:6-phosphogluconolactonase n=1 Tax=Synchytrium microbalum TaxID=1806994 RepID=A0A507CC58_9FUNG|nr:uncharacterized protein SmJEL517_g01120 [Synchytrium microbalum]TPX37202.1 hypothetical protein SmJEL517_g01120 [Synchytrium microbalum]